MGENAVDNGLLRQVDQNVRRALAQINVVGSQVVVLQGDVARAQERIKQLRAYVEDMRREQRKAAALQRALTEIVRVRQELEQKFGKYQEVRDAMIGILQAKDKGLVTTATIARVSEELMIATPQYWLAPCVIALSAWISNDKSLAQRALEEALDRDAEKTSLLMALICRRIAVSEKTRKGENTVALQKKRYEASQNWLRLYFECQNPNNISRSVLLLANACVNGVFGDDENQIVESYIQNNWLATLEKDNPNFKDEQVETWTDIFHANMDKGTPARQKYPNLVKYVDKQDFEDLSAYADRVDISENFFEGYFININSEKVKTDKLVKVIDEYLVKLTTEFDEAERSLREEERRYQIIKDKDGDVDEANKQIADEEARQAYLNEPVSLIQYLNDAVCGQNKDDGVAHDASEKKTALKFTKPYIQESYNKFMDEKKDSFPSEVKATVEGVKYSVKNAEDVTPFSKKVKAQLENEKEAKKAAIKPTGSIVFSVILAVLAIIFFITAPAVLGVFALIVAAIILPVGLSSAKKNKAALDVEYEKRMKNADAIIKAIVKEWETVSSDVARFNSKPRFDVGSAK